MDYNYLRFMGNWFAHPLLITIQIRVGVVSRSAIEFPSRFGKALLQKPRGIGQPGANKLAPPPANGFRTKNFVCSAPKASSPLKEILQQIMAMLAEDRLRMVLHPLHIQFPVANAHDFINSTVRRPGPGGHLQAFRQALLLHHQ